MVKQDRMYRFVLEEFMDKTEDGFILVDNEGIVLDVNGNYADFLNRSRDEIIGRPIHEIVSNTSMYDVLKNRHRGDAGPGGLYVMPFLEGETRAKDERYAVANRFCIFDEQGILLGAAAHMKFRQRTVDSAEKLLEMEFDYYKSEYESFVFKEGGFDKMIGASQPMQIMKRQGVRAARSDFSVLITGETGTGKEVLAKAIHLESARREGPFVSISCAAIPGNLMESELFGYEEGAFTGARRGGKPGKFQLANGGTLFLDEIGDMPLSLQAKILRALQEQEIDTLGGNKPVPIDVRVIAATWKNLGEMVEKGDFRADLYYRLSVINIETVPLRNRPEDILLHCNYWLNKLNEKYKTRISFSDGVRGLLCSYQWPGNVRELQNVVSSAYASCEGMIIGAQNLPGNITERQPTVSFRQQESKPLSEMVADYEAAVIQDALKYCGHNVKATAQKLGIDRSFLYKKIKRLGLKIERSTE